MLAFAAAPAVLRAANPLLDTQPPLSHDNAPISAGVTVDIGDTSVDIQSSATGTWEYRLAGSGSWNVFSPTITFPSSINEGQTLTYEIRFTAPDGSWWIGDFLVRTSSSDGTARYDDLLTDKGVTPESSGCCASGHGSTCRSGCGDTAGDGSATAGDGSHSDPGSLLELFELPVDPNEPDFEEGGLLLYRTRIDSSDNAGDINLLRYVSLATMKVLVEDYDPSDANLIYTCSIRQASGFAVDFQISSGETFGRPAGAYIQSGARIELLNGINGSVVTNPATATHIRQYRQNGGIIVFAKSTGVPVQYTTRTGRVTTDPSTKVQLYEAGGHLAQVKTAAGLLVIAIDPNSTRKYTVKRYLPDQISGTSAPYSVEGAGDPILTVTVEHPASTTNVNVTRLIDERTTMNQWNYSLGTALNEWTLTHKSGTGMATAWIKARRNDTTRGYPSIRRIWKTPTGTEFYNGAMYVSDQAWKVRVGTSSWATDGARSVTYFTNPSNPGAYGKISGKTDSNGSNVQYEYNSTGRMTLRKSEWLDAAASKHEVFSYAPHVSGETLLLNDYRPRTIEIKVDGGTKTISKTMFAAHINDTTGEYTEITKRAATPSSGWSDGANLVTTRTYYSNSASPAVQRGRLKQIVAPDGTITTYSYTSAGTASEALTTTVAHHVSASAPISGRSTQTISVLDAVGRVRQLTQAVYVASPGWIAYEKTYHDYGDGTNGPHNYRYRTRIQDLIGSNIRTVATYNWSGGQLLGQTDEAGTATSYEYDLYNRRFETTRAAVVSNGSGAAQPAITTTITSNLPIRRGAGIGFRDERIETITTDPVLGSLKLVSAVARDGYNRVTSRTDENGYTTQYSYQLGGRQVTVTRPDNSSEITLHHKDGNINSITGTGVVATYTAYAVDGSTGLLTITRRAATSANVRYTDSTTNMLGQTTSIVRPARDGETATTTTQSYHYESGTGKLLRTSSTADNVPHQINWENAEGTITRSVISTDATIDLDSDRISETESSFESGTGQLWQITKNFVYPNSSSAGTAVSTRKTLLGGFAPTEVARTQTINELSGQTTSISQTLTNGFVTSTTDHPETTAHSVNVSYHGRPAWSTSPGTGATTYHHDALGRSRSVDPPRIGATTLTYHDHPSETGFTTLLLESETDAATYQTSYAYGAQASLGAGRVITVTRPGNKVTNTSYTARGETDAIWGSGVYARLHLYNAYGENYEMRTYRSLTDGVKPTSATPGEAAGMAATQWNYDPATGLLLSKRDADTKGADYAYDPANRITSRKWARIDPGETARVEAQYTYTPMGELYEVTYHNTSEATADLTYVYDRLGRTKTVSRDTFLHAEYTYSGPGLSLSQEDLNQDTSRPKTLFRNFDEHLRPESVEIVGDYTTGYGYDTSGRFNRVWHHPVLSDGTPLHAQSFTYEYEVDTSHLIASVSGPAHTVANKWEDTRDVLDTKFNTDTVGTHTLISSFQYTVNGIGQRTAVEPEPVIVDNVPVLPTYQVSWGWDYNLRGELEAADHGKDQTENTHDRFYNFDAIGNRNHIRKGVYADIDGTFVDYTATALNQYTVANDVPLPGGATGPPVILSAYDEDGNYRHGPIPADPTHNAALDWDAENRLIRITKTNGNVIDVIEYEYDYLGRRIARTFTPFEEDSELTYFHYDDWNLIAEYNGSALRKTYTWGLDLSGTMQGAGGVGGLLAVRVHSGNHTGNYYPTFDGNGNVSEYLKYEADDPETTNVDEEVFLVAAHYEYDPFGNIVADSYSAGFSASSFSHKFSTKPLDEETGFYYYGYRYYDPVTGRWPSRDPIEEAGGINLYGFVGNDGVNEWDGIGLFSSVNLPGGSSGITDLPESWPEGINAEIDEQHKWHHTKQAAWIAFCKCSGEDVEKMVREMLRTFSEFNGSVPNADVIVRDGSAGFDMHGLPGVGSDMVNSGRAGVTLSGPGEDYDQQATTNDLHPLIGMRRWGHTQPVAFGDYFRPLEDGWMRMSIWTEAYETPNNINAVGPLPEIGWKLAKEMWNKYLDGVAKKVNAKCGGYSDSSDVVTEEMTDRQPHPWR